jgi:hypothetical protein
LSSSLPPAELARRDSVLFGKVKHLFSTTPKVEKRRRMSGVFLTENSDRTLDRTWSKVDLRVRSALVEGRGVARLGFVTGRWSGLTSASGQFTWTQRKGAQPVRPVSHGTRVSGWAPRGAERGEGLIGRTARPVTCDRTRPVTVGAL